MIDSVWTVEYEIVSEKDRKPRMPENAVRILKFSRDDEEGYEREKELPRCNITEGEGRTAVALTISPNESFRYGASMTYPGSKFYLVVNPKNIFSYR